MLNCWHFNIYEQEVELSIKRFYNLAARYISGYVVQNGVKSPIMTEAGNKLCDFLIFEQNKV